MDARRKQIRRKLLLLLTIFYLLSYILPLGGRPMMRPDEFRYAEIPREMIASGDWIVPRLNNIRYFEKTALGYQWTALSIRCFGQNAFAVRLPMALASGLAALFVFLLTAKAMPRDPWLAGVASGIYLLMGIVYGVGTFAVLDAPLAMALAWCIGSYYLAYQSQKISGRLVWLAVAGLAAGSAFLFKGFLAFAVPVIVIAPFLLWQKDWKRLLTDPWFPALLAVGVALPWSIAIARLEPDFWNYFFVEEHWKRFTSHTYDRDPQPFWFFIPILLGGILPSGLLVVVGFSGWKKGFFKPDFAKYCLLWALMPFLFFSASSCKLGTYILPCFAPLAILLAWGFCRALRRDGKARKRFYALATGIGYAALIAGSIGTLLYMVWKFFLADKFPVFPMVSDWPLLVTLGAILYGIGVLRLRKNKLQNQLTWLLLGLLPMLWGGVRSVPEDILLHPSKQPEAALRKIFEEANLQDSDVIAVDRGAASAISWVTGRTDLVILGKMGEFEYGFKKYPEEYMNRYFPEKKFAELQKFAGTSRLLFVVLRDYDDDPYPESWPVKKVYKGKGVTVAEF